MKIKGKRSKTLPAGVHLVCISEVKWSRDSAGEIKKTAKGDPAIDVTFKNGENLSLTHTFWFTDKAQWVIDKLCHAIGVNNSEGIDVEEILNNRLFIIVGYEYFIENGIVKTDAMGNEVYQAKLIPRFYPVVDPQTPPVIEGDPARNGGKCSGIFRIERNVMPDQEEEEVIELGAGIPDTGMKANQSFLNERVYKFTSKAMPFDDEEMHEEFPADKDGDDNFSLEDEEDNF